MISVLVLTLDEVVNIEGCLGSIPWRDDMHVLDSGSSDGTQALAEALGAQVHHRDFTTYAEQRNAGLALPFQHAWVLMIDADERLTPELVVELSELVANTDSAMAMVRRKDMFGGRWLRRSSGYPSWFPRLFRVGRVSVCRSVNEEYETQGETKRLQEHLIHYPFNKGLDWWFARHNRYSKMEAEELSKEFKSRPVAIAHLLGRDPLRRRAAIKGLAYRMPLRPILIFFYLYVLRGGFLDGAPGYRFATMRLAYELMIDAKLGALRDAKHSAPNAS